MQSVTCHYPIECCVGYKWRCGQTCASCLDGQAPLLLMVVNRILVQVDESKIGLWHIIVRGAVGPQKQERVQQSSGNLSKVRRA